MKCLKFWLTRVWLWFSLIDSDCRGRTDRCQFYICMKLKWMTETIDFDIYIYEAFYCSVKMFWQFLKVWSLTEGSAEHGARGGFTWIFLSDVPTDLISQFCIKETQTKLCYKFDFQFNFYLFKQSRGHDSIKIIGLHFIFTFILSNIINVSSSLLWQIFFVFQRFS